MPVKTYTREVPTLLTRDEMRDLLKRAHAHCKTAVKLKRHSIGKKRPRTVVFRSREEYLACIKSFIDKELEEKAKALGAV
jgi:Mg2+ and Co2+ transporter CorA